MITKGSELCAITETRMSFFLPFWQSTVYQSTEPCCYLDLQDFHYSDQKYLWSIIRVGVSRRSRCCTEHITGTQPTLFRCSSILPWTYTCVCDFKIQNIQLIFPNGLCTCCHQHGSWFFFMVVANSVKEELLKLKFRTGLTSLFLYSITYVNPRTLPDLWRGDYTRQ